MAHDFAESVTVAEVFVLKSLLATKVVLLDHCSSQSGLCMVRGTSQVDWCLGGVSCFRVVVILVDHLCSAMPIYIDFRRWGPKVLS